MKKFLFLITILSFTFFSIAQEAKDYYKEAKKLSKQDKHNEVILKCTKAIQLDKSLDDAYFLRAKAYLALNDNKNAAPDLIVAAQKYNRKVDVQLLTAKTLFEIKQYKEAIPYFKTVIEIDDENIEALGLIYQSRYYVQNYEDALINVKKSIDIQSNEPHHYYYQGLIAFANNDLILAEKAFVDCAKLNENYKNIFTFLTEVRVEKKLYKKAVSTADVAIKKDEKDAKAYYLKAKAQESEQLYDEALQTLDKLLKLVPEESANAHYTKGVYYLKKEDLLNANKEFTFAIKADPNHIKALNNRASSYEKLGDKKLANNDYIQILKLQALNDEEKKIIQNAKYKTFELNKEANNPVIQLVSHKSDDKNTVEVKGNQPIQEFKFQIKDESNLKSVKINNNEVNFDVNQLNPIIVKEFNTAEIEHLRVDVEDVYMNKSSSTFHLKVKKIDPPKIALIEPYASSNGETYIDSDVNDLFVEGKINHSEKIKSISVNGIQASFVHDKLNPTFSAKIDVKNLNQFDIEVEGEFGTKTTKKFNLIRTDVSEDNPMGKTWVIFIENSNYNHFSSLEGPTKDINLIKASLEGYAINKMIHKKDLTKDQLDKFFSIELRDLIKKNRVNSLMVWYAGHGKFVNETGYWIPVDAKRDEEYSYYNINALRASMQSYDKILVHNLVITDACESGPSFYLAMRDTPKERVCGDWEATKFRSAQVLSSAGYELAVDNSQFTKTFSAMLKHNPDNCIPIEKISNKVVEAVAQTGNQKPSLGKIKGLDDQNGTFFFIKK